MRFIILCIQKINRVSESREKSKEKNKNYQFCYLEILKIHLISHWVKLYIFIQLLRAWLCHVWLIFIKFEFDKSAAVPTLGILCGVSPRRQVQICLAQSWRLSTLREGRLVLLGDDRALCVGEQNYRSISHPENNTVMCYSNSI